MSKADGSMACAEEAGLVEEAVVFSGRKSDDCETKEEAFAAVVDEQHATYEYVEDSTGTWRIGSMPVDPGQDYKAKEIQLFSLQRPHMRGFHLSWLSFFCAFLCWFAFAPLMPIVRESLSMNLKQVFIVNVASVASTVVARIVVGPLCDKWGPKRCQVFLLCWTAVFVLLGATVQNVWSLALVRFMTGFGGATFVVVQYWSSQMFCSEIVGLANATVGGWGNLGAGVTQQLMVGCYLFFSKFFGKDTAWRVSFAVPALITGTVAAMVAGWSDDSPRGDLKVLYKKGVLEKKTAKESMTVGFAEVNSWILGVQYAACFGVELHVNNIASTYFASFNNLGIVDAALVASLFGYMNIFARSLGGHVSDVAARRFGMRGRLWVQAVTLFCEGVALVVFGGRKTLASAIPALVVFSLFVQAAEGATFGIVPFVEPQAIGGVSAIVGAMGNVGAVAWGLLFLFGGFANHIDSGFIVLGYIVICLSFLTFALRIKGHDHIFGRRRTPRSSTINILEQQEQLQL